jgi:hypothetical protein
MHAITVSSLIVVSFLQLDEDNNIMVDEMDMGIPNNKFAKESL